MLEIILYNIVFWGALIFVAKVLENAMQYTIDNFEEMNKKGK
jgi:hypothetical protein